MKSPHSHAFEAMVNAYRERLIESMIQGVPADFPAYRQLVGELAGINEALKMSAEADAKLSGE